MSTTTLDKQYVADVFHNLEVKGQAPKFLEKVADDVDWTVKGTHPLAGHYTSKKSFQEGALAKVGAYLKKPLVMKVTSILIDSDWAVVEMFADGAVAKDGWLYDNNYCWVCRFDKVYQVSTIDPVESCHTELNYLWVICRA